MVPNIAELDFLQTIKLVNYIRSEVKQGRSPTTISDGAVFDNDEYLKPVLEDDALLYSLDEVTGNDVDDSAGQSLDASNATAQVNELREELERLQVQFAEYQLQVQRSFLDDESAKLAADQKSAREAPEAAPVGKKPDEAEDDAGYFSSYSYNSTFSLAKACPFSLTLDHSYPRGDAQRHRPDRCISRFHLRQQACIQRQGRTRRRLWHWDPVHVLCKSRREDGHSGRQLWHY